MGAILYENLLRTGTLSSIGTTSGNADNFIDGRTGSSEKFATGATREFIVDNGSSKTVNGLGVGRNNIFTSGGTIALEGSTDNVSYTALESFTPVNNLIMFEVFSSDYNYRYYKIKISGHTSEVYASDIAIGEVYTLERDQNFGFISPSYADGDQIIPNMTVGQNLAGLSVKRGPKKITLNLPYYTSGFYVNNLKWFLFVASMKKFPFYLRWKADNGDNPFYCWPAKNIPEPAYSANVAGYAYLSTRIDLLGITV